jgi:hypothetical protein
MTIPVSIQSVQAIVARYLQHCLERRLAPPALEWLSEKCTQITQNASPLPLYTAFSAAPRMVGKSVLALNQTELAEAGEARALWKPERWSVDQAARCLLLVARNASDADEYISTVEKLFSTADARELVALYQAIPLLPHQERYALRAAEGVRSNMLNVFHAIALNNPYPYERFEEPAWNQMVLKVAFVGSPMCEIIGLEERVNPGLARMLRDLVHERRAAGRSFPAEVWQLMAPYADEEMIGDLQHTLDDEDASQRAAAAAALSSVDRSGLTTNRSGPVRPD